MTDGEGVREGTRRCDGGLNVDSLKLPEARSNGDRRFADSQLVTPPEF